MRLIDLQHSFRDWLRSEDVEAEVQLGGGPGPAVYLNNHRASLMASLAASYERTARWLGDEAFAAASAQYVERHAPSHWTLDAYGEHLAERLDALYPDDPEVADLARIEWAWGTAFIATDANPLDPAGIAHVDWDTAILRLVPSVRLLTLSTNADALLMALADDNAPCPLVEIGETVSLLVWRKDFVVHHRRATIEEAGWLGRLADGTSFLALCEDLVERHGPSGGIQQAGQWLAQWTAEALIEID